MAIRLVEAWRVKKAPASTKKVRRAGLISGNHTCTTYRDRSFNGAARGIWLFGCGRAASDGDAPPSGETSRSAIFNSSTATPSIWVGSTDTRDPSRERA